VQMLVESISEFSTVPLFRVNAYLEQPLPRNTSGWHRWRQQLSRHRESEDIVGGKG